MVVALIIISCNTPKTKKTLLPSVTGKAGEIVLVMEDSYWKSSPGKYWRNLFSQSVFGLPQDEPMFNLIRIPQSAFTSIFKSHRNLIFMELNAKTDTTKLVIQQDVWARPQTIITVIAKNKDAYLDFLNKNSQKFIDLFLGAERNRIIHNYKNYEERSIRKKLKTKYHISLTIPKGYILNVDSSDFVWITHETPQISQGILIYFYNYTDTLQLEKENLIAKRNEILKKYVPSTRPNSYMTTSKEAPLSYNQFYLRGNYIAQLKGLWETENDYMGGPFQSFTTIDEKRNRVVTVEGYVYAPGKNKRNYIRQLEAILFTLKITE